MARERFIWDKELQTLLPADEYKAKRYQSNRAHSVIQDSIDPFLSHADGKIYDSKAAYRAELRRRGLVELGNELPKPKPKFDYNDVEPAIIEAFERHGR
jgi:hypothetical protein